MRRSRKIRPTTTVSLFPFLAVLICTMGALIVLLVIMVNRGRVQAADIAQNRQVEAERLQAEQVARRAEEGIQIEDEQWRSQVLASQREQTEAALDRSRAELAYLDDSVRDLHHRLDTLVEQAGYFQSTAEERDKQAAAAAAELARVQQAIELTKKEFESKKLQAAAEPTSYAIVMHDTQRGTHRRPIFVECTDRGVILQPEGIVLGPDDFASPLPALNPLDAALLAVQSYLTRYQPNAKEEPYPLLLVRPDGAVAYAAARSAMQSWGDRFGYELIEADLKIAYPEPDPALKAVLEETIENARLRMDRIAAARPSLYVGSVRKRGLRVSNQGGFVEVDGGGSGLGGSGQGGSSSGGYGGTGSGGSDTFSGNHPDTRGVGQGSQGTPFSSAGRGPAGGEGGGSGGGQGTGAGGGQGAPGASAQGAELASTNGPYAGQRRSPGEAGQGSGQGAGQGSGSGAAGDGNGGGTAGGLAGGPSGGAAGGSSGGAAGGMAGGVPNGQAGGSAAGTSASGGSQGNGGTSPIAATRGSDWALSGAARGATAITRPVTIYCTRSTLTLQPERGLRMNPQAVPIGNDMRSAASDLVVKVQDYTKTWGLAGATAYWRPILSVHVEPGAEFRYQELEQALQGSGLILERKNR
ncbi:hypothetical protein [Lignipirellula cremea]|uniref:Uncharacterized protein n=1 Tax=Lignipirellula cremea TaxID=2528010 RepID=A0A518DUF8_9BACT|nr:hypothetical protein [Lignipirellula cremea]QDU95464.1 hypothetical protein Pla8534_32790 [Lignipirellula cremea]